MVNFCQTTLVKKDVSQARVAELSKKKLEFNSSVVLNCNYSVINCVDLFCHLDKCS